MSAVRVGALYFAWNAIPESGLWCTVTGSHWGLVVDPPKPLPLTGALFSSRAAAEAYRAAAEPGTAAARDRPLVRVRWRGLTKFQIVPDDAETP